MTDEEIIARLIELPPAFRVHVFESRVEHLPSNRARLDLAKEREKLLGPRDAERLEKLLYDFLASSFGVKPKLSRKQRREARAKRKQQANTTEFSQMMIDLTALLADVCRRDATEIMNSGTAMDLVRRCSYVASDVKRYNNAEGPHPFPAAEDALRASIMLARCEVLEEAARLLADSRN